ncbi:MAG: FYDLN acid domain-containing protein [Anaeromyxobacter sp.]
MPAKDLGTKHTCYKCGTKFYDLKKPEPLCPKCGADQRQSPALRPAERRKPAPKPAPVPVEAPEVDAELDDDGPLDDDEDDAADDDDEG